MKKCAIVRERIQKYEKVNSNVRKNDASYMRMSINLQKEEKVCRNA